EAELWTEVFTPAHATTRAAFVGKAQDISIAYSHAETANVLTRWLAASGILVFAGVWFASPGRRSRVMDALRRWPHLAGVLVGLAWWLWLAPSIVGLALAIFCILVSFRSGLRAAPNDVSRIAAGSL